MAMKFDKKAIRNTEISKKQANLNQNKPKNKQPASLKKNRKLTKNKPKFAGKPQGWQHWSRLNRLSRCPVPVSKMSRKFTSVKFSK